jgi:hypothetical protein
VSSFVFQTDFVSPGKFSLSVHFPALFIPPKQDQAFNQGGTFLFDGDETIFAHYDESTGAHSDIDQVIGLAKERIQAKASEIGMVVTK